MHVKDYAEGLLRPEKASSLYLSGRLGDWPLSWSCLVSSAAFTARATAEQS